jgi:hypothetical protein
VLGFSVYCVGNGTMDRTFNVLHDFGLGIPTLKDCRRIIYNFISSQDVDKLASKLPNLLGKFLVPLPTFNHLDFLWAMDGDILVYNKIISQMNSL